MIPAVLDESVPMLYPNWWENIIKRDNKMWLDALSKANGPDVLLASSIGGHLPVILLDSILGIALTLRGYKVHILLCDGELTACELCQIDNSSDLLNFSKNGQDYNFCKRCFLSAYQIFNSLGFKIHRYSENINNEEKKDILSLAESIPYSNIRDYYYSDLTVGEHAWAGSLRFFARGTLDDEPNGEAITRRYLYAALLTAFITNNLFKNYNYVSTSFHHGIYVPQGIIGEVARREKIPVNNWSVAYRKKCFIFSHNETYHHEMLTEPIEKWENILLNEVQENEITDYLKSRAYGTQDWFLLFEKPITVLDKIEKELGISFLKPTIGLLTNVMWDAQLHYCSNAFPNMVDWILETISYFSKRPDLQLIIRVHPAEVKGTLKSRQPIIPEILKTIPSLPSNVIIIPPDNEISTYTVMQQCDSVLIYGTKTGVELTSMGIPVIVAGEAWIRNKGVTTDATSPEQYFSFLDKLPLQERLDEDTRKRALRYAYHFFFRRMIPLEFLEPTGGWPPYKLAVNSLLGFLPGNSTGLDVICNGIITGSDFIYPAEMLTESLD